MSGPSRSGEPELPGARLAAYAAPTLPESAALIAAGVVVPGFYTAELAVPAAAVGLALLISRSLDAVIDPLVGVLSDATRSDRFGRKPLLLFGSLVMAAGAYGLFTPPARPDGLYLSVWLTVFYAGWTLYSVPYEAWGAEIGRSASARARVFGWRTGAFLAGMAAFFIVPMAGGPKAISRADMSLNGLLIAAILPITALLAALLSPPGAPAPRTAQRETLRSLVGALRANRPFQLYLVMALISGLGSGMNLGLVYIIVAQFLKQPAAFSLVLVVNLLAGLVSLPLWRLALARMSKSRVWALGLWTNAATLPMFLFIPPGPGALWPVVIIAGLSGATYAVCNITQPAVLGDVVDYDTWRTGSVRTGAYFAFQSLVRKFNTAVGGGVGFLIIAAFGYAAEKPLAGWPLFGVALAFAGLPTLLQVIGGIYAWVFPVDDARHALLARRLAQREARAQREGTPA